MKMDIKIKHLDKFNIPLIYNGRFPNKKLKINKDYLATIITSEDIDKLSGQMLALFDNMGYIFGIVALILFVVIVYLLTKVVIDKSSLNISLMKVFGYRNGEARKIYLNAITATVMMSLVICIPIELRITEWLLDVAMLQYTAYIPMYVPPYLIPAMIIIGFASYMIVYFIHTRRINAIQINKVLKGRELQIQKSNMIALFLFKNMINIV